jgi:aspartoacylase
MTIAWMKMTIKNVAIVGGTHGNEFTGAYLLKRWKQNPDEITRPTFATHLFFGNPKAFSENRRFIDEDLNRCFSIDALLSTETVSYEANRATVLNQAIGPKGQPQHDLVIDLHTSTSNCGGMIILLSDDAFNLRLAAYLSILVPKARIYYIPPKDGDQSYLGSICAAGLTVEVGPIPQGLLRYDIFHLTNEIITHALDYINHINLQTTLDLPKQIEVFRFQETVSFPEKDSNLGAIIHESLQDKDYEPLNPGDPIFRNLDGTVIYFEGTKTVYPVFINEAAYYYNHIAMSLTSKEILQIPVSESFEDT